MKEGREWFRKGRRGEGRKDSVVLEFYRVGREDLCVWMRYAMCDMRYWVRKVSKIREEWERWFWKLVGRDGYMVNGSVLLLRLTAERIMDFMDVVYTSVVPDSRSVFTEYCSTYLFFVTSSKHSGGPPDQRFSSVVLRNCDFRVV